MSNPVNKLRLLGRLRRRSLGRYTYIPQYLEGIMLFDWDEEKRKRTLQEREIDFIDAAFVWEDPLRQERIDERHNYG